MVEPERLFQLDPVTLQNKEWQRTVISVNTVSPQQEVAGGDVLPRFLSSGLSVQVSVKLSMRFTSREFSLKRMPSRKQSGVFGVKINVVTK